MRTTAPQVALMYWQTKSRRINDCIAMFPSTAQELDMYVVKRVTGSYITSDPVQRYAPCVADNEVRLFTEQEAQIMVNQGNYMAKSKMFTAVKYVDELYKQANLAAIMIQVSAVRVKLQKTANHVIEFWQ